MSAAKVGAVLLVLLILAVQPCWSQCEPVDSANLCTKWSNLLKNALLDVDTDLRPLRDAFFPLSRRPPVLVQVHYTFKAINQTEVEDYRVGWSSSRVFAAVDPGVIVFLQSMMLDLILIEEGFMLLHPVDVVLYINTTLPRNTKEFNYSLERLTSELKGYVSSQGAPDETTRGYTWSFGHPSHTSMNNVVRIAVLFTQLLVQIILLYLAVHYVSDLSKRKGPIKVLIWSIGDAISLINMFSLILELLFASSYVFKNFSVFFLVIVAVIPPVALSLYCNNNLPPAPKYAVNICSFWNCCMTLSCCLPLWIPLCSSRAKNRIAYCGLFINYSLFVNLIAMTTIPSLLFLGLFPLETTLAISLLSFVLVFYITFITTTRLCLFVVETSEKVDEEKSKKYLKFLSVLGPFIILSVIIICVLILYIRIIAAGVETNSFFQFLISIFPAVAAAVIGVWVKKRVFKKSEEITAAGDTVTQTEDREPLIGNNDHTTIDIELEPLNDQ